MTTELQAAADAMPKKLLSDLIFDVIEFAKDKNIKAKVECEALGFKVTLENIEAGNDHS